MTGGDHGMASDALPGHEPASIRRPPITVDTAALLGSFAHLTFALERDADVSRYLDLAADLAAGLLPCRALALVQLDDQRPGHIAFSPNDATFVPWVVRESTDGPWFEAARTGEAVVCTIDDQLPGHLAGFGRRARAIGLLSCAVFPFAQVDPGSRAGTAAGALVALRLDPGRWTDDELGIGMLLATVVSAQLHQHRAVVDATLRAQQLQHALDGRVVVEQAKGMVAVVAGVSVSVAFELLRARARRTSRSLLDVATDVVERRIDARQIAPDPPV